MPNAFGQLIDWLTELASDSFKDRIVDYVARAGVSFLSLLSAWLIPNQEKLEAVLKPLLKGSPSPGAAPATTIGMAIQSFAATIVFSSYVALIAVFLYRCIIFYRAPAVPSEDIALVCKRRRTILGFAFAGLTALFVSRANLQPTTILFDPFLLLMMLVMIVAIYVSFLLSVVPCHFILIPPHIRVATAPYGCRNAMRLLTRLTLSLGVHR